MHFLERPSHLLFLLLALPPHSNADIAKPTSIYIDLVPRYKNLSACAEAPLSSLVRNMWNGCGDNSELTSYSCFCTDSYSKFSWDISTAVVGSCGSAFGAAQATSAVSVFHNYCANGTTQLSSSAVVTTAMGSGSSTGGTVTSIPGENTSPISVVFVVEESLRF
jgi:hypothetical protein